VLSGTPQFQGAIEGNFALRDNPEDKKGPPFVIGFELDAGYFDKAGSTRLSWYDADGKLLGRQTNTGLGIQRFVVAPVGNRIKQIAKWRIEAIGSDPAGFAIDNVCFTRAYNIKQYRLGRPPASPTNSATATNQPDFDVKVIPLYPPPDDGSLNPSVTEPVPALPSVAQLSCLGIGTPVTKPTLNVIAKKIDKNATRRQIADGFEIFALQSTYMGKFKPPSPNPFKSPERRKKSMQGLIELEPDSVGFGVVLTLVLGELIPVKFKFFPNTIFVDAKAYSESNVIQLNTSKWQVLGFLDYLSHYSSTAKSPLPKSERITPTLLLLTTADSKIAQPVLNYSGMTPGVPFTPVEVWQAVACKPSNVQGDDAYKTLQMGNAIPLNLTRPDFLEYIPGATSPYPVSRPLVLTIPERRQ
jgi:hypothetical protein